MRKDNAACIECAGMYILYKPRFLVKQGFEKGDSMQVYERSYDPPIYDLENFSAHEQSTMLKVLRENEKRGVDFFFSIVSENDPRKLEVFGVGSFSDDEIKKCVYEIIERYKDENRFERIQLFYDFYKDEQDEA